MSRPREVRTFACYQVKADTEKGVLDKYVSVFGIADSGWMNDIVEPGAFQKTIAERGPRGAAKIRALNQHRIGEVIGVPLALEEHGRDRLPARMLERYPNATGGLFASTQLVMSVSRVRDVFELYNAGAMDEWSIGFETIASREETVDGESYRHLTECKLWEYSAVTFAMNEATTTVGVKSAEIEQAIFEILAAHPHLSYKDVLSAVEKRFSAIAASQSPPSPSGAPALVGVDGVEVAQLRQRVNQLSQKFQLRGLK